MAFSSIERHAKRLRIYVGDSDQWRGMPLYLALLAQLKQAGLAGATVIRGVAGFGAHSRIHTASIISLSADLPLVIEVIDSPDQIQHALDVVSPMVREGLITLEDVEVISYIHRYLRPLPADRQVREVMTQNPVTARADQPLIEAWRTMLEKNLKALPVLDAKDHVVGLLTHEDLIDRAGLSARLAVAQKLDAESLQAEMDILMASGRQVADVMSQPAITLAPDDALGLAAERLVRHGITRLPVVDSQGKLIGVISRLDVLRQVVAPPYEVPEKQHPQATTRPEGRLAGDVMALEVPIVPLDTNLAGIISSFLASGEHRVIVANQAGQPVGLISDSDVVDRIQPGKRRGLLGALRGRNVPDISITASDLMSPGVETVGRDISIVEAVQKMVTAGRKWLVVVDVQGRPVGLIDREIALEALIR